MVNSVERRMAIRLSSIIINRAYSTENTLAAA
jgi:hypothetical protein